MQDGKARAARAQRIAAAMNGRTVAWLAEAAGVALSTAHGYLNKGTAPPADIAVRVADALGIDLRWYITGERQAVLGEGTVEVPLVGLDFAPAGTVTYGAALVRGLGVPASAVRCIFPAGAAMRPTVPEASEVLYGPMPAEGPQDGRVYVLSVGGRAVVRRVERRMEGSWLAACDNPAFRLETREKIPDGAFVGEVLWVSHRP